MRYDLKREDFEEMYGTGNSDYPKTTVQVVMELRTRGLDVRQPMLDYAIKRGFLPDPAVEGVKNRQWSRELIDAAADYFYGEGFWTPYTTTCHYLNLDPAQLKREEDETLRKHPELRGDRSYLVMTIYPGAPGVDLPAIVKCRPMNTSEQAEYDARLRAAKRAMKDA